MSLPIYPVTHNVPAEFGLHVGYDFIRQSSVSNPEMIVFEKPHFEELSAGAIFQLYKNYDFEEGWNGTLITTNLRETIGNNRNYSAPLSLMLNALERQFYRRFPEIELSKRVVHTSLNGASVADAKMMTELSATCISTFRWREHTYFVHPTGPILNDVHFKEMSMKLDPKELGNSLSLIGHYDVRSPVKRLRASRAYYSDSQRPLIAVQLAVPELAIFRLERKDDRAHTDAARDRISLVEYLQFKDNIVCFCWDERPSLVRDTESLVILTADGALYLWQGSDKLRVLRSADIVDEVCEPLPSVRHTQGVASITKIADVGKRLKDDAWLPNYGSRIFFSGHPSCVLVLTGNSVEKIDFSKSESTQETLLSLFKPPSALDVRLMKLKGQYENVATEKANKFNKMSREIDKRRKQLLEEDEEAFRTTMQIRLEAEEAGRPIADNPVYKFYTPILTPFDVEYEAKKKLGPTLRLMQDEQLCDAVQHPLRPFCFAILTTIRVYLLDERHPDAPLIQWRHHLIKCRRSLFERRIPFSLEQPHSIQFILPPPHLAHLNAVKERTFVLISNQLESEIYTFDQGPVDEAINPESEKKKVSEEEDQEEQEEFELLKPYSDYKRRMDADITSLMDAITRDITRPNDPPVPVNLTSNCLDLFIPPPCPPRLIGLAQKVFQKSIPFLEEVDPVNSEHIKRVSKPRIDNISTTSIFGLWTIGDEKPQFAILTIRMDVSGNLFSQFQRFVIRDEDKEAIAEMVQSKSSESVTESSSESSSSSSSGASSSSSSKSSESSSLSNESSSESFPEELLFYYSDDDYTPESLRPPDRESPFYLKQQGDRDRKYRTKFLSRFKTEVLTKPNMELPTYYVVDATKFASIIYDPRPGFHHNDSYPASVEERRLKSLFENDESYDSLYDHVSGYNQREKASYRAIKRRIDPYTQTLVPSETRNMEGPDLWDISDRPRRSQQEKDMEERVLDEDGKAPDEKGDLFQIDSEVTNPTPSDASSTFNFRKRKRGAPTLEERQPVDDRVDHPVRKRVLRKLPEDILDLSQVQYNYFLDTLESVLDEIEAAGDWDTKIVPEIAPRVIMDAMPYDRDAVERIVRRALTYILKPQPYLRTTAEYYRDLVSLRLIHPLYFPPSFLRSILAYYVTKGKLDYISMRGMIGPALLMSDNYASKQPKPWTLELRAQYRNHDPYLHFLNLNDETDAFIINTTGVMDVDAQYIIGKTTTPRHEPIPANREKSTVSDISWRTPRLVYPPPEEAIQVPSQRMDEDFLTQAPLASSSQAIPIMASQSIPATQPLSVNLSQSMDLGNTMLRESAPSFLLNRSMSLSFTQPTQLLSRRQTEAQIKADTEKKASKVADLESQQSQILELLQTQQTIADLHQEQENRELAEDKKEDIPTEKLNAPANASQLMALLLCKWENDYDNTSQRVADIRKVLRKPR